MQAICDDLPEEAIPKEESVAIRKEDWPAINKAIGDAIAPLQPRGWRKALFLLREWSVLGITATVIVGLLALAATGFFQATTRIQKETTFETRTEDRLTAIEKDIGSIKDSLKALAPLLRETTIKRINEAEKLSPKQLSEQLPDLKSLAKTARAENIAIKPETIETVGKKLIEVGGADAWDTALDFLNYKSFLNASLSVAINNVQATGMLSTHYIVKTPLGIPGPTFSVAGAVPKEQAAQFLEIGKPDPNASSALGNDWIIATDGAVTLDNMQLKKVIFRNVQIFYSGGPLRMQDVYFINCTFYVQRQSSGERFAATALEPSAAVNFTAS